MLPEAELDVEAGEGRKLLSIFAPFVTGAAPATGRWRGYLGEAERCDGEVVALEAQDRQADEPREEGRNAARRDERDNDAEYHADSAAEAGRAKHGAEGILKRELDSGAAVEVIDPDPLRTLER